jgi:hypothetical protein
MYAFYMHQQGVDFDETFGLVVKLATVHVVLSISLYLKWETCQLDVKTPSSTARSPRSSVVANSPASSTLLAPIMSVG